MNLIYHVRGGYYDYDAMTALSLLLHSVRDSSILSQYRFIFRAGR